MEPRVCRRACLCAISLFIFFGFSSVCDAQSPSSIQVQVLDSNGAAINGARLKISKSGTNADQIDAVTDEKGAATITVPVPGQYTITAQAAGFGNKKIEITAAADSSPFRITLEPESLAGEITIAAGRSAQRLDEAPASVVILKQSELTQSGATTLDDVLRSVPGFTLFRRTSSRYANPTSQGVSLRGVGPSGASRTAVVFDGIPLNDPFGGWIYWDQIPRESIDSIEVVRGGESNLYGTDALGGVIGIKPKSKDGSVLDASFSYGNLRTPDFSLYGSTVVHKWELSIASALFRTDGYILTAPESRGAVDTPANSDFGTLSLSFGRQISPDARIYGYSQFFRENRHNGTPVQTNDTGTQLFALGGDFRDSLTNSNWHLRAYGSGEVYHQTFSTVVANRATEALNRLQRVPTQQIGATIQWEREFGARVFATAGVDGRQVRGVSQETAIASGVATSKSEAGGRQRIIGAYGQTVFQFNQKLSLTAGIRVDRWNNFDGQIITRSLTGSGQVTTTTFADHDETAVSPKLALVYHPGSGITIHAAGYRAFRAPTLNELYRSFRVGNVNTLQNPFLLAEHLTGAEGGVAYYDKSGKLGLRGTFFWNKIVDPVANLTLSVTPALITRQRANLGRTGTRGVELESEWRASTRLSFSAGYIFDKATVDRFPVDTTLEGLWIPQVPRHVFTVQSRYSITHLTASLQGRFSSHQFDDDRNQFSLGRFFLMDAYVGHPISRHLEVFVSGENIFNTRYEVGKTPLVTLGTPALVRIGVRIHFGE